MSIPGEPKVGSYADVTDGNSFLRVGGHDSGPDGERYNRLRVATNGGVYLADAEWERLMAAVRKIVTEVMEGDRDYARHSNE